MTKVDARKNPMNVRAALSGFVAGLLVLAAPGAHAGDDEKSELGTFEFKFENDLFSGSDRHYTNGMRLSWLSPEGDAVKPLQYVRDLLESLARDTNKSTRFGLTLGQDIYTPEDRHERNLITTDRPYGAWLYGGLSLHTITDRGNGRKDLESIELDVGVVGPHALGEEAQNFVHEVRLIDTFDGWDNQIKNEIGVALYYERKWRFFDPLEIAGPVRFDAIPHAGVTAGNVVTQGLAGGALRIGYNLPGDFGPPSIIHGGTSVDRFPEDSISAYLFATARGRYVAHNIFLDGNTFRDSHGVDREPFVGDFSAGAAILIGRFRLSYANALRTREFEGQPHNSRFGSITASWQAFF